MYSDEYRIHGMAYSFHIPWSFIERAAVSELADEIADRALSIQHVDGKHG